MTIMTMSFHIWHRHMAGTQTGALSERPTGLYLQADQQVYGPCGAENGGEQRPGSLQDGCLRCLEVLHHHIRWQEQPAPSR